MTTFETTPQPSDIPETIRFAEGLAFTPYSKLSGGVVSTVYGGWINQGTETAAVAKVTSKDAVGGPQFGYSDQNLIEYAPRTAGLDAQLLLMLRSKEVPVPLLLAFDPDSNTTLMEDFRQHGYQLMQDRLINGSLPAKSAKYWGAGLANICLHLGSDEFQWIEPVELAELQARERLEEAYTLLHGNLGVYHTLYDAFLTHDRSLVYTDGHPKNMAVKDNGEVMFIDFGRTIHASVQFVMPNSVAHLAIPIMGGLTPKDAGLAYIRKGMEAFNKKIPIVEPLFVQFFAAELVHRCLAARWIDPKLFGERSRMDMSFAAQQIFWRVFMPEDASRAITTIDGLMTAIETAADQLAA